MVGEWIRKQRPVTDTTLLGSDDLVYGEGVVLDCQGDDRQPKGHLEGGELSKPAADADGAVRMSRLSGAEGHPERSE